MNIGIVGAGVVLPNDLTQVEIPPAWRKATRNMIMAVRSMEAALRCAPHLMERDRQGLGLVVGTNSGEIETSADFITTLARSHLARPLLFQNSLHNATAGFASIHFGLTGPAFTISDGVRTPSEAVGLASMLLKEGVCTAVIVTLVEVHKLMADYIGQVICEGACTLVVTNEDVAREAGAEFTPIDDRVSLPFEVVPEQAPLFDISRCEFFRTAERLRRP